MTREEAKRETELCEDAVSRQAAIDALNAIGSLDTDADREYARQVFEELPSAQPEQQWIPCSERLPEEKDAGKILKKLGTEKRSEYVLATVEVKGERMTVTACTYDGMWHWDMQYAFPGFKVIAWMSLPEPYREDGEKE